MPRLNARRACALVLSLLAISGQSFAQTCDRDCLGSALTQYLKAVVDNDPSAAPIAVGIRQTANAVSFAPGGNVWQSVTGLGDVQRRYLDEVSGQAAYYGTVEEGDATALVTARIRVQDGQITEAEWYVARENDPGLNGPRRPGAAPANLLNPAYLAANPPPDRIVPRNERLDRDRLLRIAHSYFDALTSRDRTVALVHEGCGRAENGSPAPGGAFLPPMNPGGGNQGGPVRDCLAGLEGFNLSMVVAQRFPIVDVEAQAVLGLAVFIRRPGSPTPRNVFSEWFFVDEGKIRTIYTAMFYPPPELAVPNWPPYTGNWPLPAGVVPQ